MDGRGLLGQAGHGFALGYVVGRLFEATAILVGVMSLLAIVTLRHDLAGATGARADSLVVAGRSLVAIHDWTFLFGPNLALGPNTLMLAYLMYRSRLVPRSIAVLGLIGGPAIFAFATAVLFGLTEQVSAWGALGALPVFAWEMSLAAYLIVKGFRPAALASPEAEVLEAPEARPTLAGVTG